jgi:Ca2+-binding EF-hand superfamily protein
MKKVFNVFDRDHDGSITIEDVQEVMNSLSYLKNELEMPSIEQIKIAFEKFDENSKCDDISNFVGLKISFFLLKLNKKKKMVQLNSTNS